MKKPLLFGSLKKNNKGSALVTVIISMVFIMALGAALLFSTYMSYKIAISQRRSAESFYTAESMADDIRFGLQAEATRALKVAYTEAMTEYIKAADSFDPQAYFAEAFKREMQNSETRNGRIFYEDMEGYRVSALSAYVNPPEGSFSLGSGGSFESTDTDIGEVLTFYDEEEGRLTKLCLIKLGLRYTSSDGYESRIITDIVISVPDFYAKPISSEGLGSYAIVADKGIVVSSSQRTVTGKAYSGSISINNSGSLKYSGGDLIVKSTGSGTDGTVKVENSASFQFNGAENELWAGGLIAAAGGSLQISGRAYVADDLMLEKDGKAKLSGSYFGFGDSFDKPKESSAIIVNGGGAKLDISGLDRLSLGGVSFIDVLSGNFDLPGGEAVPMGESLSIKTNQLAYLVPAECIQNYASNPFAFNGDNVHAPIVISDAKLWTINGKEKTLNDYLQGPDGTKGRVMTLYKPLVDDNYVAYVFLQFNKQEYANQYFQDFFEAYPDRISKYMESYLELINDDAKISSAGNAFYMENGGTDNETLILVPASPWSENLKGRFNGFSSPFTSFVNTTELNKLNSQLNFYKDHKLVAIVANKDCRHDSQVGESLRLIIASGDVIISGEFKGIVLTNGRLLLNGNITGQPLSQDILEATAVDGTYTLSEFIASGLTSGSAIEDNNPWAPEKLVYYENWTKN